MSPEERMYPASVPTQVVDAAVTAVFGEFERDTWRSSALREVVGVTLVAAVECFKKTGTTTGQDDQADPADQANQAGVKTLDSVWELRHQGVFTSSSVGLYSTKDQATLAAQTLVTGYRNRQQADPEDDTESVWETVVWGEHTDPDFGYIELRGQFGDNFYFVLAERTLNA